MLARWLIRGRGEAGDSSVGWAVGGSGRMRPLRAISEVPLNSGLPSVRTGRPGNERMTCAKCANEDAYYLTIAGAAYPLWAAAKHCRAVLTSAPVLPGCASRRLGLPSAHATHQRHAQRDPRRTPKPRGAEVLRVLPRQGGWDC
jgi:hypothetical protein